MKKPSFKLSLTILIPLLLSLIFIFVAWQIIHVRFTPPIEGSIMLKKATLYSDNLGLCDDSIPDNLATDDVIVESLPSILSHCVKSLKSDSGIKKHAVNIPHEWRNDTRLSTQQGVGKALYHFEFPFAVIPEDLWAIVLPMVSQNTAVFLNGNLLGWGGSFEAPVARNASSPQMFTFPSTAFHQGINELDIYLISEPFKSGFLGQVHIAPAEVITPAYQKYSVFRHTVPLAITLTIAVISFLMLLLWVYRRQDTEYGLFALSGFFWVINTLNQFVIDIPFSGYLWDGMIYLSSGLLSLSGLFFIHRLLEKKQAVLEKSLVIVMVLTFSTLLILPKTWVHPLFFEAGHWISILAVLYLFSITVIHATKAQQIEWHVLALAIGIIAFFALYDVLMMMGLRPLYEGRFLHFGAPFLLISFSWIMLQRFISTLNKVEKYNLELEQLNQGLEDRVKARGEKIAESYEMIRVLGQERVLADERSRIMRDMHDGIGVYLTSMIRQIENNNINREQLSESAHNALNDLRLMIDSLGSASTDIPAMLGMFRTRINVMLTACQIELVWHVEELPPVKDFGPERALNLLRILQEAVTNALKHSGASRIGLSAYSELTPQGLGLIKVEVYDNGKGFSNSKSEGNGLKNMEYRAKKIAAEFKIETNQNGSRVIVTLPITMETQEANST